MAWQADRRSSGPIWTPPGLSALREGAERGIRLLASHSPGRSSLGGLDG